MTGIRSCGDAIASFAAPGMMVEDSIVSLGFVEVCIGIFPRRWLDPAFPQAGKTDRIAIFQHHPERLPFRVTFLPFKKTVHRTSLISSLKSVSAANRPHVTPDYHPTRRTAVQSDFLVFCIDRAGGGFIWIWSFIREDGPFEPAKNKSLANPIARLLKPTL